MGLAATGVAVTTGFMSGKYNLPVKGTVEASSTSRTWSSKEKCFKRILTFEHTISLHSNLRAKPLVVFVTVMETLAYKAVCMLDKMTMEYLP